MGDIDGTRGIGLAGADVVVDGCSAELVGNLSGCTGFALSGDDVCFSSGSSRSDSGGKLPL